MNTQHTARYRFNGLTLLLAFCFTSGIFVRSSWGSSSSPGAYAAVKAIKILPWPWAAPIGRFLDSAIDLQQLNQELIQLAQTHPIDVDAGIINNYRYLRRVNVDPVLLQNLAPRFVAMDNDPSQSLYIAQKLESLGEALQPHLPTTPEGEAEEVRKLKDTAAHYRKEFNGRLGTVGQQTAMALLQEARPLEEETMYSGPFVGETASIAEGLKATRTICFVCTNNLDAGRSHTAQILFQEEMEQLRENRIEAVSRGLEQNHLTLMDVTQADTILVMIPEHLRIIQSFYPGAQGKTFLLAEYAGTPVKIGDRKYAIDQLDSAEMRRLIPEVAKREIAQLPAKTPKEAPTNPFRRLLEWLKALSPI